MPYSPAVLSCFYGGAGKCSSAKNSSDDGDDEDDDKEVVVIELEPELVAEPPVSARSRSFVGTHEYLAPEVISGGGHGSAVDWWTLGVFLYEMMYGRTPFKGDTNDKTLINILKMPLTFPTTTTTNTNTNTNAVMISTGNTKLQELDEIVRAQDLIRRLLVKNPRKRLGGVKGSVEIKNHDFFKGLNWALIRSVKPPEVPRDLRNRVLHKKLTKKERDQPFGTTSNYSRRHFEFF